MSKGVKKVVSKAESKAESKKNILTTKLPNYFATNLSSYLAILAPTCLKSRRRLP